MSEVTEKNDLVPVEPKPKKKRGPYRRRRKDKDDLGATNDEIIAKLVARGAKIAEFNHVVFTKANIRFDYGIKKWLVWHDKYRTPTKSVTWGQALHRAYAKALAHTYASTLTVHAFRRAVKHMCPGRGGTEQVLKVLASDKSRDADVATFKASLVRGQQHLSVNMKDTTIVVAFPPLNSLMSMELGGLAVRGCQVFAVTPPASEPWWGFLPGVVVIDDVAKAATLIETFGMPPEDEIDGGPTT